MKPGVRRATRLASQTFVEVTFPLAAHFHAKVPLADQGERMGRAYLRRAVTSPEVRAKLEDFGLEVLPGDGPALAAFIQQETRFWHALIKERRLSAEP